MTECRCLEPRARNSGESGGRLCSRDTASCVWHLPRSSGTLGSPPSHPRNNRPSCHRRRTWTPPEGELVCPASSPLPLQRRVLHHRRLCRSGIAMEIMPSITKLALKPLTDLFQEESHRRTIENQ